MPVVFALADERVLMAVDFKPKRTTRLRRLDNIAATGRVSLLVDEYDEEWDALWWVRVDGHATVVPATDPAGVVAIDALVAKYAQYVDTRPGGPAIVVGDLRWRWWSARPRHP